MALATADHLDVQVLVDNMVDSLSSVPTFVKTEWRQLRKLGMSRTIGSCLCCAAHGLSLVVTAFSDVRSRSVLFDGGPEEQAMARNAEKLGVDFATIDAVVLSHGHWDHAGGLPSAFKSMREAKFGAPTPLYLHPGMFRERASRQPEGAPFPMEIVPAPEDWASLGAHPIVTTEPQTFLDDLFYVSGEIPRVTPFEQGLPGQVRRTEDGSSWEPDELLMDERFLAVNVKDKGLVVFTACSHAGVINVLTEARNRFPGERLYAVMGGLHLSGDNERIIPETVRDLAQFDLALIITAHCTGWRAVNALERAFGDRVVPAATGKLFHL
ncbi:MAG: MBL fold metallo-hydrolase [Elsteraceae bacterium]